MIPSQPADRCPECEVLTFIWEDWSREQVSRERERVARMTDEYLEAIACERHLSALKAFRLWALPMLQSTGAVTGSGLFWKATP